MENLIFLAHVLTALAIIGLILLQQGKGAEMGASFGSGASQTLFGASGSGNFFSKLTAVCAFIFFVTSFSLAVIAKQKGSIEEDLPGTLIESSVETPAVSDDSDIPGVVEDLPEAASGSDDTGNTEDIPEVPEQ